MRIRDGERMVWRWMLSQLCMLVRAERDFKVATHVGFSWYGVLLDLDGGCRWCLFVLAVDGGC